MACGCVWLAAAIASAAEQDAGNTYTQGLAIADDCR